MNNIAYKIPDTLVKEDSLFTAPVTVMVQTAIAISFAFYYYFTNEIELVSLYLGAGSVLLLSLAFYGISKLSHIAVFLVIITLSLSFLYSLTLSFNALSLAWCLSSLRTLMEVCRRPKNLQLAFTLLAITTAILFSELAELISSPYSTAESLQFIFLCSVCAIFVFEASTSRSKYRDNVAFLALHVDQISLLDALTGLHNRQSFEYYLEKKYTEAQNSGRSFAIILADIDNFKSINERYGHSIGDNILTLVGQLLNDTLSENYNLARWTGNTFIALIPHDEPSTNNTIAELLRKKVNDLELDAKGAKFKLSMSIGIASTSQCSDLTDFLSSAENSLYQAKNMGGNMAIAS